MNEDQIRSIIQKVQGESQFGVPTAPYHIHNNIDSPFVPFSSISEAPHSFCVAVKTNGTTPTPVFGTNGTLFNGEITGIYLTSLDTTAGTISLVVNSGTIGTIAKGATAGVMVGATDLSTGTVATFALGTPITVVSSSAGNAMVFITYIS